MEKQKARHTPGPWEILETPGSHLRIVGNADGDADDEGRPVYTSTHVCDVIDNDDEAGNALLIKLAPAMLDLLRRVEGLGICDRECIGPDPAPCASCEAAILIARVEGGP